MVTQTSAPTRLEEILAEWDMDKDLTQSMGHSLNSIANSITVNASQTSPYTVTGAIGTGFANSIWTTTGTGATTAPWIQHNPTGAKIQLDGANADITVNGWSLVDAVKRIEERLGLYQPNPALEKEWEDLRALGDEYRRLEQHIRDKQSTWERLKAMPAPNLD